MHIEGTIFDLQRWSLHDGPGIRTNVFLKGCPLACKWCSNPESQELQQELAYFTDKCIRCGSCAKKCPHNALRLDKQLRISYDICRRECYFSQTENKFSCVGQCYAKALKIMGKRVNVEEVIREVLSDKKIYDTSGGGMTVTGGEPFAQPDFLRELLKEAKRQHLHTAVESCLYAKWERIENCLEYIDFLFMDLKILDGNKHRQYTGKDNQLILENMKRIGSSATGKGLKAVVRTPVILGVNDTPEDITAVCNWIKNNLPYVTVYQLLPYHRLGRGKYQNIGKSYEMPDAEVPEDKKMDELNKIILDHGLEIKYE